jgi:hypothetical protein
MQIAYLQCFFRPREVEIPLLRVTFASLTGHKKWSAKLAFFIAFWVGRELQWTRSGREKT